MSVLPQSPAEVRKRFLTDFPFYAKHCLKIRTKDGTIAPLALNKAQVRLMAVVERQLATSGKVRVVILKGRQQGLSTVAGGLLYWKTSQAPAQRSLVMAHLAESAGVLFEMTKRYHENCPAPLKQSTKWSNKKELAFDGLDSSYLVATAGADSVARGETIQNAHLSEVAFWPTNKASAILNGLLQAVPNKKGTMILAESTANGMSGVYYDLWQGAVSGQNGFEAVFIPWFEQDEYREPVPRGFKRTPEEHDIVRKFGLDDEQLMFRRMKIGASSRDQFMQEYPCHADEAFLTSGMPVFQPEIIAEMMRTTAKEPIARLSLEGDEWQKNTRGQLSVYLKRDREETYTIGVDIAMGIRGRDFSVAQVLDSKKRQAAVWRGHMHPARFATILEALGRRYNFATIIPERNNHGLLTCEILAKDLAYPNVYLEEQVGDLSDGHTEAIGFYTSPRTKPLIINKLRAALINGEMTLYDRTTLAEMQRFVVKASGQMEADDGRGKDGDAFHDDCVMALALANHIHEGAYVPVDQETGGFYLEAI